MLTKNKKADQPENLSHIFLKLHPTILMFKGTVKICYSYIGP